MTSEEKREITDEICSKLQEYHKKNNNGIFKKVIAGVMVVAITSGFGGFIGVRTTLKVDQHKIKTNSEEIVKVEKRTNQRIKNLSLTIEEIKEEQSRMWSRIIDNTKTVNKVKKDEIQ